MDWILKGLTGVACFFNNSVRVKGSDLEQGHIYTKEVLEYLKQNYLHINKNKSKCFQTSVKYLDYIVNANGLHKKSDKIEAILYTPKPTTQTEIKLFLSFIDSYNI